MQLVPDLVRLDLDQRQAIRSLLGQLSILNPSSARPSATSSPGTPPRSRSTSAPTTSPRLRRTCARRSTSMARGTPFHQSYLLPSELICSRVGRRAEGIVWGKGSFAYRPKDDPYRVHTFNGQIVNSVSISSPGIVLRDSRSFIAPVHPPPVRVRPAPADRRRRARLPGRGHLQEPRDDPAPLSASQAPHAPPQ